MFKEAYILSKTSFTLTAFVRHRSFNIFPLAFHPTLAFPGLPMPRFRSVFITMDPLMSQEMGTPPKGFAAQVALVWLLPCVDSVMFKKAAALAEGFPTVLTLVGLLPSVGSLVLDKV